MSAKRKAAATRAVGTNGTPDAKRRKVPVIVSVSP